MSIMASQTTTTRLFVQQLFQANNKDVRIWLYWPFEREIQWNPPTKGHWCGKAWQGMTSSCVTVSHTTLLISVSGNLEAETVCVVTSPCATCRAPTIGSTRIGLVVFLWKLQSGVTVPVYLSFISNWSGSGIYFVWWPISGTLKGSFNSLRPSDACIYASINYTIIGSDQARSHYLN